MSLKFGSPRGTQPFKPLCNKAYDSISGKFSAVVLTQNGQVPAALIAEITALKQQDIPVQVVALAIDGQAVSEADVTLTINSEIAKERFFADAGAVYLVRPGHHINGRWVNYRKNAITETLHQFTHAAEGVAA